MTSCRRQALRLGWGVLLATQTMLACSTDTEGRKPYEPTRSGASNAERTPDAGEPAPPVRTPTNELDAGGASVGCDASVEGCGSAPPAPCLADCTSFVSIDDRLKLIIDDLQTLTPEQRTNARYLDLSSYANAGHGEREIELFRQAISYLMNSLSSAEEIALPVAIDAQRLLFRIPLDAYGWTPATWELLVAGYPYAVRYDATSRLFPSDEIAAEQARVLTGTQIAYVQADWFFSHAVRPPLYHTLLGMPDSLDALARELNVDVRANIAANLVVRAGFADSGPSRFNRVIERHLVSEQRGALWLTYDFNAGSGTSNVFTHPLDFVAASSEVVFPLPNGLSAYMIVDGAGRRLDQAPRDAVQDPLSRDLAIENGISCISCHIETGMIVHADEIRSSTLPTLSDPTVAARVAALYPEKPVLDAVFAADRARYQTARDETMAPDLTSGIVHELDAEHLDPLDFRAVAGVLGIEPAALASAIAEAPGTYPPELVALSSVEGATLARDAFEVSFPQIVSTLGLGQVIAP